MNEKTVKAEFSEPAAEVSAPIGTGSSAFEKAVTLTVDDRIETRVGRQRWVICALLFFAATVNYIDRQVIGILKPTPANRVRLDGD